MLSNKYTYIDNIDIELTDDDVQAIAITGDNDIATETVIHKPYVMAQFKDYSLPKMLQAIQSYGVDTNGYDDLDAIKWLVWTAAWNIAEGQCFDVGVA